MITTQTAEALLDRIDTQRAWEQLISRDPEATFFYGVITTGVYCRPGCASRMPSRQNVRFFSSTSEAVQCGFRACLRCKPDQSSRPSAVSMMCAYLQLNLHRVVTLAELGQCIKLSPFTAQRIFKQAMGATPAQYQRSLRAMELRKQLQKGKTVTDAIYEAGYGSSSRAYEQKTLGMTPGRFAAGGRGETIRFAVAEAPVLDGESLGWMVVGATERGICWLAMAESSEAARDSLRKEFPSADLIAYSDLSEMVRRVIESLGGTAEPVNLPLDLRGTAFQLRVWNALQQIPAGETRTYSQLATEMGIPSSTRAVARACATNRVSVLVPCHRVIGASGSLTGYRWGVERKQRLLAVERANSALSPKLPER